MPPIDKAMRLVIDAAEINASLMHHVRLLLNQFSDMETDRIILTAMHMRKRRLEQ